MRAGALVTRARVGSSRRQPLLSHSCWQPVRYTGTGWDVAARPRVAGCSPGQRAWPRPACRRRRCHLPPLQLRGACAPPWPPQTAHLSPLTIAIRVSVCSPLSCFFLGGMLPGRAPNQAPGARPPAELHQKPSLSSGPPQTALRVMGGGGVRAQPLHPAHTLIGVERAASGLRPPFSRPARFLYLKVYTLWLSACLSHRVNSLPPATLPCCRGCSAQTIAEPALEPAVFAAWRKLTDLAKADKTL